MAAPSRKTILILTPTFVPDAAAVGQHMADLAVTLVRRGHRVRVFTSNGGYDDPTIKYPPYENYHGVEVRRLPFSSFGKSSFITRGLGSFSFMTQCFLRGLFMPKLAGIIITTSPPLSDLAGCFVGLFRRKLPIAYWAMDLYAEQVVALKKMKPSAPAARILQWIQRFILRRSTLVVALDRFMAQLLDSRVPIKNKLAVTPPWPLENHMENIASADNPFRKKHGLDGKFVVMYSGNHTPTNPLTTLLRAAVQLRDDTDIRFLFVGGGRGKKEVEDTIAQHQLPNALSLPYQPLSELKYSLTAADVHVVTLGEKMVGIVHPCKVYGAMAAARPVLYFGPKPSHISDLLDEHAIGWHVSHGDVDGAVTAIRAACSLSAQTRQEMGERAQSLLEQGLSQQVLSDRLCAALEKNMNLPTPMNVEASPVLSAK